MAPQLMWIGLGNIGRAMVTNIANKTDYGGKSFLLYNRSTQRASDLQAQLGHDKAQVVTGLTDAVAQADIIFICLSNDAVVTEHVDKLVALPIQGKLIVDCSTVSPQTSNTNGEAITKAGGQFLAAPVFGAPPMAIAGTLVIVPAGPRAALARAAPYFQDVTARATIEMPDEPWGQALKLKVIGNGTLIIGMVTMLSEAHTLANGAGVKGEQLQRLIDLMFGGPVSMYSKRMLEGDYYGRESPMTSAELVLKDGKHAKKLADDAGVSVRSLDVALDRLGKVVEREGGKGEFPGMYGVVRMESGMKYENKE